MATAPSDFVVYLLEMLAPLGDVYAKRMFGGYGIYSGTLMFGLVAEDAFYLKVDEHNSAMFQAKSLAQFRYQKQGKQVGLAYYEAPSEALDDAQMLCEWAVTAYQAALRVDKK